MPLHATFTHTVPDPASVDRAARVSSAARTSSLLPGDIATALSPTEWMVFDPAAAIGNASAILGFIQLFGDSYEVTRIGGSVIEFSSFHSLAEAVTALSAKPVRRLNLVAAPAR